MKPVKLTTWFFQHKIHKLKPVPEVTDSRQTYSEVQKHRCRKASTYAALHQLLFPTNTVAEIIRRVLVNDRPGTILIHDLGCTS